MDGKILSIMFTASTAVALVTTTPAQAQTACPERLELLKQFADGGTLDDVSKEQIDEMALEAMENEEACERTVAELERRLKVEVREDEVVRIGGEDEGDLAATATDEGGIGVEGPPAEDVEETLAAGDEQT
ncbi:MAG: hypothetical protein R3349_12340, partial [Geminicoccaceae bacterium]|nr:hypothetical protein [Geminicoccaceae bacterium]